MKAAGRRGEDNERKLIFILADPYLVLHAEQVVDDVLLRARNDCSTVGDDRRYEVCLLQTKDHSFCCATTFQTTIFQSLLEERSILSSGDHDKWLVMLVWFHKDAMISCVYGLMNVMMWDAARSKFQPF